MSSNPTDFGVVEASQSLAAGEISARDLVEACLARIETDNDAIKAITALAPEAALRSADEADERRARGEPASDLDGVPFVTKDNIDIAGMDTTGGFNAAWPAKRDAGVISELRTLGMIPLGKANMHEGALGATTDNPFHGQTQNPLRVGWTPGGSSGGSAAAVASRMVPWAIGTDTMGSVRIPAAYCGLVGLKPSRDTWPRDGMLLLSSTLDHIGPIARSVGDIALLMQANAPVPELAGLSFGMLQNFDEVAVQVDCDRAFTTAHALLAGAGVSFQSFSIPDYEPSPTRRLGLLVIEYEGAQMLRDKLKPDMCSEGFRSMLAYGARAGAERYEAALGELERIGQEFCEVVNTVDVIVSPTAAQTAFPFETPAPVDQADLSAIANFSGCPAISIPLPVGPGEMPTGLQLIGRLGEDARLIAIAQAVERLLAGAV